MPRRFRQYLTAFSLPFMLAFALPLFDGGAGGDPPADPPDDDVKFDDKQQAKFNAAIAAERKATEDRIRAKLKTESETAEAEAKTKREQEEAEKRGEFDTVKKGLEGERDKAAQERDGYKADLDILTSHFETEFEARVKALPDNVWKYHKPADDASLAVRIAALANAEAQAKDLGLGEGKTKVGTGNPPNPKPRNGEPDKDAEDAARRATRPRM